MRNQWTYDKVKEYFEQQNCKLLSTTYKNQLEKLDFTCSCGHTHYIQFKKFLIGHRCKYCKCGTEYTQEMVEKFFTENNCILLDTYINFHSKLKYQCNCGKISTISFSKFKAGRRCSFCKPARIKQIVKEKYGVDNISQLLNNYSKESQKLFWLIYEYLSKEDKAKTYFAELNKEFESQYPFFRYDFVISSKKKCIEYNGKAWHPTPDLKDTDVGWHAKNPSLIAGDQRAYEALKFKQLTDRDFSILIVWDYEMKQRPKQVLQRCLDFLK